MLISKFSRDGKSGFAVGSNSLTPEKIAAGLVTAASGLLIAGVGGLFGSRQKTNRAGASKAKKKKKNPLWLAALPLVYKGAKNAAKKSSFEKIVAEVTKKKQPEPEPEGVEVIDAIPIHSEEEVYDHI